MREVTVFFGPPGTGKTYRLSQVVEEERSRYHTEPGDIAFVSFSRRAIAEARERNGIKADTVGFWRTIHSLAYRMLELSPHQVIGPEQMAQFAERIGEPTPALPTPGMRPWEHVHRLGTALQLHQQARARMTSLEEEWGRWPDGEMEFRFIQQYVTAYQRWKAKNGLYDFEDMIESAQGQLPVAAVIIDEAQDTSPASWAFLRRVIPPRARVYVAGDDDQTIYGWAGADASQLVRWKGERIVLPHSWRLPQRIKDYADSITRRITQRYPKPFTARDEAGTIQSLYDPGHMSIPDSGSVLLLARTRRTALGFVDLCRRSGVTYSFLNGPWSGEERSVQAATTYEALRKGQVVERSAFRILAPFLPHPVSTAQLPEAVSWEGVLSGEASVGMHERPWYEVLTMSQEDRSYIRALRRRGEPLHGAGRVRILTIHQSKGAEADHVLLNTRVPRLAHDALRSADESADAERRVWYVGATRARQSLTLLVPGRLCFE